MRKFCWIHIAKDLAGTIWNIRELIPQSGVTVKGAKMSGHNGGNSLGDSWL